MLVRSFEFEFEFEFVSSSQSSAAVAPRQVLAYQLQKWLAMNRRDGLDDKSDDLAEM